ncbi:MAG: glycogen synthase [Firmicutes bacterium]|nr:glycogen synthase [Candidatus Colimorpha enterica]
MKILFAASEAAPFVKTGGLGDVALALPKALSAAGHEVKIFIPLYGRIKNDPRYKDKLGCIAETNTRLGWRNQYTGIWKYKGGKGPEYYFIDNEYYFARDGKSIYGDYDDGERFAFFSRAVIEAMGVTGFVPDVIHCNDWQTAALPVFLRRFYPQYGGVKVLFTIHNIEYQGKMPCDFAGDVMGLDGGDTGTVEYDGCVNLMKGAIVTSDAVSTVSETYAEQILDPFYSHGLHSILAENRYKLSGIVNGIDTDVFNPATDRHLYMNYVSSLEKKRRNKVFLQEKMGLKPDENVPLIAMVSRLVSHKGLDIVESILDGIASSGAQLALLGSGDSRFEQSFSDAARRHPGKIAVCINFDPELASQMYAGADMFLMPSLSEHCGLSQLIAMRYGCVPIVRETGGLKDTVPAYDPSDHSGSGFTFVDYNGGELFYAVKRCLDLYFGDRKAFEELQKHNIKLDFSWKKSVEKYVSLYDSLK